MPLTDIKVKSAKPLEKQYKLSDDGGLYYWLTLTAQNIGV